jgi:CheY-like chemotaxis protein
MSHLDVSSSLRVLLVDDQPDLLSMLDLMMKRRKYAVKTAQSGDEALQLAPDFAPHVVISDIGMPGMDGYQLMTHLRSTPDWPLSNPSRFPVTICTRKTAAPRMRATMPTFSNPSNSKNFLK